MLGLFILIATIAGVARVNDPNTAWIGLFVMILGIVVLAKKMDR